VPRFGPLGLRKRTQRGRPTIESGLTLTLSKLFAMGSFGLDAPGVPSQAKALFQCRYALETAVPLRLSATLAGSVRRPHVRPMVECQPSQDARWVCENHPDKPWGGGHGECCDATGRPCPDCNELHDGERPAMAADFTPAFDRHKGAVH
jgi:hypothetical protein